MLGFMTNRQARHDDAREGRGRRHVGAAALCVFFAASQPVRGQAPAPQAPSERQSELRGLTDTLRRSEAEQARLRSEIAGLRGDRARLGAELIKSAEQVRQSEERIAAAEIGLREVLASESALRRSLEARRGLIVEVLAALQRMGRKPPPAVVVRPDDMRQAIRAAIVLGHVLPEIRVEAERLVADLGELMRLRQTGEAERLRLTEERDAIQGERARLAALVEARQSQIEGSEKALAAERARIDGLSKQSQTLKELIARAEAENEASQRALDQARKDAPAAAPGQDGAALAASAFKDTGRLSPKIAFADARGLLAPPVFGPIERGFGAADGFGGTERGLTIAAAPEAVVTAPCDGWVLFAGPYRSYGRVLILNAGGGYNFVMTGLQHTSVEIGQFILAGEPIGSMGPAETKIGDATARLPLYVELRKDNQPIDSAPWWMKPGDRNVAEKARG